MPLNYNTKINPFYSCALIFQGDCDILKKIDFRGNNMDSSTSGELTFLSKSKHDHDVRPTNSLMRAFQLHPHTWSWWKEVLVHKNICYGDPNIKEHVLDVYKPKKTSSKRSPVCLYIHGGGFLPPIQRHTLDGSTIPRTKRIHRLHHQLSPC